MAVTRFGDARTLRPRRAHEPQDQPDRDHHDGAEQEIGSYRAYRIPAQVPDRLEHAQKAVGDVAGSEVERAQDDADEQAKQKQPQRYRERRPTKESAHAVRHGILPGPQSTTTKITMLKQPASSPASRAGRPRGAACPSAGG